ncbi:MAG: hypothetical protein HC916_10795 [Coleofasciculaceae cyanobacterium SM2_1_6]|nr:hypothetical protein [Coleofasciculaceae cyanobacterium SM2_1_6]
MIDDDTKFLVNKYKPKGILVDTNILLLWFIGSVNRQRISQFNRTEKFTPEDYTTLVRVLTSFSKIITTPNILTEISNLVIKDIKKPELPRCFEELTEVLSTEASFKLEEYYIESRIATKVNKISEFSLTDCSILELARDRYLVLTDDSKFAGYLTGSGIDVVNFNNLRNM